MDELSNKVYIFPKWKTRNCKASEKLCEAMLYLEKHPEDMQNLILIWVDEDGLRQCETDGELTASEAVFLLEQTKFDIMSKM